MEDTEDRTASVWNTLSKMLPLLQGLTQMFCFTHVACKRRTLFGEGTEHLTSFILSSSYALQQHWKCCLGASLKALHQGLKCFRLIQTCYVANNRVVLPDFSVLFFFSESEVLQRFPFWSVSIAGNHSCILHSLLIRKIRGRLLALPGTTWQWGAPRSPWSPPSSSIGKMPNLPPSTISSLRTAAWSNVQMIPLIIIHWKAIRTRPSAALLTAPHDI